MQKEVTDMNEKTSQIDSLLRKSVRQLEPYHVDSVKPRIKLDANENNWMEGKFQPALKELISTFPLHQYPDSECLALRHKLALMNNVHPNQVITGVGSDQIIAWIIHAFVESGDKVLIMDPTFTMYEINTLMAGGNPVKVPLGNDFSFDAESFLAKALEENPKVVFLTNPNNPTGGSIPSDVLIPLIHELAKGNCVIAIDEAYYEFFGETAVKEINNIEQLIILRTLSKAYGLAGIRAGYAIASEAMMKAIFRVKPPYHMSGLDQLAAMVCLDQAESLKPVLDTVVAWRDKLADALCAFQLPHRIRVYPSKANFLLIHTADAADLNERLREQDILVRSYGSNGLLADCLRITIGTEAENEQLLEVLEQMQQDVEQRQDEEEDK
jgi:histidinol-phosphate aminotransferase